MGDTPEQRIQKKILKYLEELKKSNHPIFFERREAGGLAYKEGLPDLYAVYNGVHIEIEVKAPGGEPSASQLKWERFFKNIGAIYIRAFDAQQVKDLFESFYTK